MNYEYFRVIPGYENYSVTCNGVVKSIVIDTVLSQFVFNGYLVVSTFRGSPTTILPVHRAVALAWVENPNASEFTVVNHLDGNPVNNHWTNLEWTTVSGNNYHAVNNGLRIDNIPCKVRDFMSGMVYDFSSMAQAAEFMGLRKDAPIDCLRLKKFGALVSDRFEFRQASDPEPWFYETRSERVPPSRYMVTVIESDGTVKEVYSTGNLLRLYQLYGSPSKSIPELAKYGNLLYTDKLFIVTDSYSRDVFRENRKTNQSRAVSVTAKFGTMDLEFRSLTDCASYFNVDRSTIFGRINNGKDLGGWTFTACLSSP